LVLCLASCSPQAVDLPTRVAPKPTATGAATILHAPDLRFALIGEVTDSNVWALFDSKGYSYNNYAVRSEYWPRLYALSIPDGRFETRAASGMPSAVQPEGGLFAASVPLRSDLTWTDGSPFTADDVAFTVNTVLSFQLGFDWHSYYDPEWLDHAEAVDAHTVKFYFKRQPTVAVWQYGALQGPVVQKKYWSPKIADAAALLPPAASTSQIELLKNRVDEVQKQVNAIIADGLTATGEEAHRLQGILVRKQGDLDQAVNNLSKAEASIDLALEAARQSLYVLNAQNEPTLGNWTPSRLVNGAWVNMVNPSHPFGEANFDRVTYALFGDQASAVAALARGEVDSVLEPNGLSPDLASRNLPGARLIDNASFSARFLIINPANQALADPEFRRALFCSIDRGSLARAVIATPLAYFLPRGTAMWFNPEAGVSCGDGYDPIHGFDPAKATDILKSAGYTWSTEPSGETPGKGLMGPNGNPFPTIQLLLASQAADAQSAAAAQFIESSAHYLGIPVREVTASPSDIRFAVFNDGDYDLAILGWRLSSYPGYLCDWFGDGNPFHYNNGQIKSACQGLRSTSDLDAARGLVSQIQSLLAQNLPFIPLYSGLTYDVTRGIRYPFDHVLGGLSGHYGAPSLAVPASP
jgi:ABC-type transport system substrate-binding protein